MTTFKPLEQSEIGIIVSMMEDFYAIDNYAIDADVSKGLFHEFIANENLGRAYLICAEDEVVGYVVLTFVFSFEYKGTVVILDELYIKEDFRKQGIGGETIRFIQQEAKQQQAKLIYLEVENHNQNAQKLYFTNQFEVHHRKILKYNVI